MKKIFLIVIVALAAFVFAACGDSDKNAAPTERVTRTETTAAVSRLTKNETAANTSEAASDADENQTAGNTEETMTETMTNIKVRSKAKLLYMGHSSIRITTPEGKVVYIDPYAGNGYGPKADLILVTHGHYDHNNIDLVKNKADDCRVITWKEALSGGKHLTFDLGYIVVESVEAGYNRNHSVKECVGYVITLSDGVSVYVSGDTSTTKQMPELAEKHIDYAFYCCDGVYNMDLEEASKCAKLVGAKHDIPYHVIASDSGSFFDRERAQKFDSPNLMIINEGEETELC